jgi:D-hexose-6-phosphate mutarotase
LAELRKVFPDLQVDRVYLSSSDVIAVFDHEQKRTFTIRKEGLPDVGKFIFQPSDQQ